MSILIKGIDMPKKGRSICLTIWSDGIVYTRDIEKDVTLNVDAQAIQIFESEDDHYHHA